MFNSNDPAMNAAIAVLFIMAGIILFSVAAIAVIPVAVAYGGWKYYQHTRPLPTYEPAPVPEPEPFEFTDTHLREHVAIFAPSGWGKTQFLESYIHMLMTRRKPPALFVLDSQDDMLHKLQNLELILERTIDDIYIIDPSDKPALNFFKFLGSGSDANDLFAYLFSSLEHDLSGPQTTVLGYLMRLMRVIPDPTIKTLLKAVEGDTPHPAIAQLDETAQEFFRNQFYKKGSMQLTRTSVANRCYSILQDQTLEAMFSAPENNFDPAVAMERGAWCFINTSIKQLGSSNSALLGRYFIAQILAGCYRLGPTNRLRAVLVLDEAFEYFDEKTERILSQARKYGLGLTFATQHLSQMDQSLRKAVFGNTAVKVVGKVAHDDAVALAKEMEISPDHIRSLEKTGAATTFIASATGHQPFPISVPFGALDREPWMTEGEYRKLRELNRERLATKPVPKVTAPLDPTPPQSPPADDDPSKPAKW